MLCAPFLKECSLSLYAGNFYLSFMCPDTHHVFPYQLHRALVVIYLVVIQRSLDTTKVRDQLRISWMVSSNVFMPEYH